MKDEATIRAYRDSLQAAADSPCTCADKGGLEHAKCKAGERLMLDSILTMSWVLGDFSDAGDAIMFNDRVRRITEAFPK